MKYNYLDQDFLVFLSILKFMYSKVYIDIWIIIFYLLCIKL